MDLVNTRINKLFALAYSFMLLFRIYTTTGTYKLDSRIIEICYVILLLVIEGYSNYRLNYTIKYKNINLLAIILLIYYILFCFIFVNPEMQSYTSAIMLRKGLFLTTLFSTFLFVKKYRIFNTFITSTFFVFSFVLISQFLINFNDITHINLLGIFNISTRSRANFGLGHYNTLGAVCVVSIVTGILYLHTNSLNKGRKLLIGIVFTVDSIMLVGSASRNAIIGLIVFFLIQFYLNLSKYYWGYKYKFLIKFFIVLILVILLLVGFNSSMLDRMVVQSNRATLFDVALPTFFESNRTFVGLGLASNEIYGLNKTPYTTYWLDNGYIYTLVTTGYLGAILYGYGIFHIGKKIKEIPQNTYFKKFAVSIFVMYLFGSMFESTLFSGSIQEYVYCLIFLLICSNYFSSVENNFLIQGD